MRQKVFIKSFGCLQSQIDGGSLVKQYQQQGCQIVTNWKEADLVIIKGCVVRESAENRIYGLMDEIRKEDEKRNKKTKIILSGCLARVLVKIPKRKKRIMGRFKNIEKIKGEEGQSMKIDNQAFVSISSGCNNFCSYCIVPLARGKERSRKMVNILKETDNYIKAGIKELVLVGQNVNSYGQDLNGDFSFAGLLEEVAKKNIDKISFVSSNPWDFGDDLIEVIAKHKNIDRLVHLPLQSGDDLILKKMKRLYTAKQYLELVDKIKEKVKGVSFSTDIIVGFPTEDERAFENTVKVCKKVGFELAYLNKYSPRKGTLSARIYKDDVPMKVKKERWNVLDKLINKR